MNSHWYRLIPAFAFAGLTACASMAGPDGGSAAEAPPGGDYRKVSELVELPDFIPGMGTLYVQPDTLPAGPFLAYDRSGKLVSTVYMIPLDEMQEHTDFERLGATGHEVVTTDVQYNAGHPGVAEPHYHIVLWHVAPGEARLE